MWMRAGSKFKLSAKSDAAARSISIPSSLAICVASAAADSLNDAKDHQQPQIACDAAEERQPPIPADLMARVYHDYERRKEAGSLPTCRLRAATTVAVSLLDTLTSIVKRE